jgi:hypothetical protein
MSDLSGFWWFARTIIISILIIASLHGLYEFYKTVSTPPKIRDLANERKYEYEVLRQIRGSGVATTPDTNRRAMDVSNDMVSPTPSRDERCNVAPNDPNEPNDPNDKNTLKDFMKQLGGLDSTQTSWSEFTE